MSLKDLKTLLTARTIRREDVAKLSDADKVAALTAKNQHLINKCEALMYKNDRYSTQNKKLEARIESVTRRLRESEKFTTDQAATIEALNDALAQCDDTIGKMEKTSNWTAANERIALSGAANV